MNKKIFTTTVLLSVALAISGCSLVAMKARRAARKNKFKALIATTKPSPIKSLCTKFKSKPNVDFTTFVKQVAEELKKFSSDKKTEKEAAANEALTFIGDHLRSLSPTDATLGDSDSEKLLEGALFLVDEQFTKIDLQNLVKEKLDCFFIYFGS